MSTKVADNSTGPTDGLLQGTDDYSAPPLFSAWATVHGQAAAMGSKRIGRRGRNGPPILIDNNDVKLRSWQQDVRDALRKIAPPHPIAAPFEVVLDIQMRRPKDQRSASGDPLPWAGPWVGTKPDGDKLTRAILDCGTGLIWTDDSLVARGTWHKSYTNREPLVVITIRQLDRTEPERKVIAARERAEAAQARREVKRR